MSVQDLLSITQKVHRLVTMQPSLAEVENRNLLCFEYWRTYDRLVYSRGLYQTPYSNITYLTPAESITRALRRLIHDGEIQVSPESEQLSEEMEQLYRSYAQQSLITQHLEQEEGE